MRGRRDGRREMGQVGAKRRYMRKHEREGIREKRNIYKMRDAR